MDGGKAGHHYLVLISDGEVRRVSVVKVGSGVLWKAECRIEIDSLMADLTDLTLHDVLTTATAVHISTTE